MLKRIGDEGVLAMVCDSTNVFVEGEAGSEAMVRANLEKLIKGRKGRVAVTCFASNLARVESVALAAVAAGRHPVLSGRALTRMLEAAQECGYLLDFPECVARAGGRLPAARQGAVHLHGQPGRAARLDVEAGRRRASRPHAGSRRHRDLLVARHSRATSIRSGACRMR